MFNQLFFGPKWKDGESYRLNAITAVSIDNGDIQILDKNTLLEKVNKDTLVQRLHDHVHSGVSSTVLRKNLILNGVDYWLSSPAFGIGAGQYNYYSSQGKNKYPVESL